MKTRPKSPNPKAARSCRRLIAVLTTVAFAAALSACGSKSSTSSTTATNVDTAKVARSIEESIVAQRHLKATVVCPVTVPAEQGKTFNCVATTHTTKAPQTPVKTTFVVTVQNSRGGVTYVGK